MDGRTLATMTGLAAFVAVVAYRYEGRPEPRRAPETSGLPPAEPPAAGSRFGPTVVDTHPAPEPAPEGMAWIPGAEFSMGASSDDPEDHRGYTTCGDPVADAQPVHRVRVDGFWMDRTEVTNEQFARFVAATGYVTVAERTPTPAEFPPPENLVVGSVVFDPPRHAVPLDSQVRWWS
jgi:formylglycine-generating enzyme required for sulfatase activity